MSPELKPGVSFASDYTVPPHKTVPHLYAEFEEFQQMPQVFATGFLVGLIERVCQLAIKPFLDWPSEQSVGTFVSFSHLAATPPGLTIRVTCTVTAVEGRRVRFQATAHDGVDLISEGTHERTIIDTAKFQARSADKLEQARVTPKSDRRV
jgi:fluoroacetyl-CoA thioesterase